MNYKDTVIYLLTYYPKLYLSRIDVDRFLFTVIGNGYRWENGELIDPDDDTSKEMKDPPKEYFLYNSPIDKIYIYNSSLFNNFPDDIKNDWKEALYNFVLWCLDHQDYIDGNKELLREIKIKLETS